MSINLILIGGGGHCKSCIDVIESTGLYEILGILDKKENIGKKILNYNVIGTDEDIESFVKEGVSFLITIGQIKNLNSRKEIFLKLKNLNAKLPVIISNFAIVSKYSEIGDGSIIMHHAIVNAGAKVGKNCIINSKSLIEHDANIMDYSHISTSSIINGGVTVGEGCFIGSNSTIRESIEIGSGSIIGAGSFIRKNVKSNQIVYG
jgi:sugar O-acyltransferase (sialic acid O-acetyltransferase NeuD family)